MKTPAYLIAVLIASLAVPAIANACSNARDWSRYGYEDYWMAFQRGSVDPFQSLSRWNSTRSVPSACRQYYQNGATNARAYAQSFYGPYN